MRTLFVFAAALVLSACGSMSLKSFEGTTPTQAPSSEAKPDGDLAAQKVLVKNAYERLLTPEQTKARDALERQVVELRRSKSSLDEADYYGKLEALLLELARLYDAVKDS